jgi:hypothetical protein
VQDRRRNSARERLERPGRDDAGRRQPLLPGEPECEAAVSDGSRRASGAALSKGSGLAGARNGLVLREVNDRIAELAGGWNETGVSLFVCECSDQGCAEALEIGAAEYERIRADESHFVVFPGHEQPESNRVVERSSRFVVVANAEQDGAQAGASEGRRDG